MDIYIEKSKEYPKQPRVVIQCKEETKEVTEIIQLLKGKAKKLIGYIDQIEYVIPPKDVLYMESVDGTSYLYTSTEVYKVSYSLAEFEVEFASRGFFRCSKSVVLNIHAIEKLKSEMGNRIDAMLMNKEHIIISRRYAKQLRTILKGE